jgi:glutaredoxin 3
MPRIKVYSTAWCGYCRRAKSLLDSRGIDYEEIMLDDDPTFRERIFELSGQMTVPLITLDESPIGGYRELHQLDRSGRLQEMLAA